MRKIMNIPVPGMRIVKTALAVFLCLAVVDFFGEHYSGYSAIVAIVCMQKDWENSLEIARNRSVGTVVGALFGVLTYKMIIFFDVHSHWFLSYMIVALMMIVLMIVIISINKHTVTAVTCIVFLSVAVLRDPSIEVWFFAFRRMIDTFVGIGISLMVNLILTEKFLLRLKNFFGIG